MPCYSVVCVYFSFDTFKSRHIYLEAVIADDFKQQLRGTTENRASNRRANTILYNITLTAKAID